MTADDETPEGAALLTRIVIERHLWPDGRDVIQYRAEDSGGEMPGLVEQLGMLTMSIDTATRMAAGDDEDES